MEEVNEIKQIESTNSIKLIKGQKGNYGWEIKIYNNDSDKLISELKKLNSTLLKQFNNMEE